MIAEEAYVLSKSFTKKSLDGQGALKGAPCTIKSITEVDGGQKVTFEWTGTSGTKQTSTMIVKNGVSVTGISDKGNGKFTLLLSDGSESDPIQCVKGEDGFSPTATVEKVGKVATITITDKNGTTTATIKDGEGSEGGEANATDSISVNGVNVVPDENKNVDITVPSIEGLAKDADLATVAKSGDYEDLANKPEIPSVEGLAKTTDIPTKVSELTDSADYAKTADVNDSISALQTGKADASDLTAHTNDTDIHVTADDKTLWNTVEDKVDKTSIATALDDTVTDEQVTSALLAKTELDKKVDKTSIATELSDSSTNDEVIGAKLAYDELKKAELANKEQFANASSESISVNDSVDGKIRDLKLYGKSEQKQYTGKNLLNTTRETFTIDGITFKNNSDGTYTVTGTSTQTGGYEIGRIELSAGNYKLLGFQGTGIINEFCLYTYTGTRYPNDIGEGVNFTLSDTRTIYVRLAIPNGTTINMLLKPMIVDTSLYPDTTYDDFEPYVGGTPSPNPNYPQTINSVGDDGSLVIKSENKNILNIPDGSKDSNGITTTALNGRITCSGTSTAKFADVIHNISILFQSNNVYTFSIGKPIDCDISIKLHDSNGTALSDKRILKGSTSITFTAPENVARATFYIAGFESGTAISISNLCIQVEKGDIATLPVPHKETVSTIPLSEPLRSIGDIKDEITYQNGKWVILRRIKEINLTDLAWELVNNGTYQYWRYSVNDGKEASSYNTIANIIAEKYMASSWYNTVQLNSATNAIAYGFNANNTSSKLIAVHNGSTTESPTGKFLYELVTPTFEPLADQTLPYLSTYDGVTNISNDDALSAEMTVKYPTTDASGVGSRNESRIADIDKNKVDKSSVVTTLGSSSTDTQVPSAKAVWNKSKNKIQRLLDGVDIIVYADSISNELATDTVRIMNATNSPYGVDNVNNDFHYTIYNVNDDKYKRILAYDIRKNDMYMIMKKDGMWGTWAKLATMDKLGGLTFSASGTTLSITDGKNTWTLEANS